MKTKSIKGSSAEEIMSALQKSIDEEAGFKPTMALAFLSRLNELEAVRSLLTKEGISIFGATTSAEFTEEGTTSEGIALLLLDIDPGSFKIILNDYGNDSVYETGRKVAEQGLLAFKNPAFVIAASNYNIPASRLMEGMISEVGTGATIVGGMAGDMHNLSGEVFTNNRSTENGVLSLVLDHDKISLGAMAVSGWRPMGTEKRITRSDGSWIYTIDDQPAFDVIMKFLGQSIIDDSNSEGVVRLNINYPFQLFREGGSPMMLPVLFGNTVDRSIMMAGPVKEGDPFRFSMPPDFEVIQEVVKSSIEFKNDMPEAEAMIIFSCIGRLSSLGPMAYEEVEGLAGTWNTPMAGFFSLGEFGRVANSISEFHGATVSWIALKEN